MTRTRSCSRLAALILAGIAIMAAAQDDTSREDLTLPGELPTCNVSSASRTREDCGVDAPRIVRIEKEFTRSVELAAPTDLQCETRIDLEYDQRDTIARVKGVLENDTCAASSGDYEVEVLIKDENGEVQTFVFSESWQRDDDRPVAIAADYPIGENVELIRLRSQRLRCTCSVGIEE